MATEAQRLIGISLAKIAQSRCGRGGVSLHKNLLVATVLQKARFIFMEEAYHMVHGHYLQANKFLEPDLDVKESETDQEIDDCELDDIFDAPISSIGKDEDSEDSEELCDKENSPPDTCSLTGTSGNNGLTYFDLDVNKIQRSTPTPNNESNNINSSNGNNNGKRRREISEWETEEAVLSILPKRIKGDSVSSSDCSDDSDTDSIYNDDESVFLNNDAATNLSMNVSREIEDEMNNNHINNNNNSSSSNNNNSSNDDDTLQNGPSMEGIDRITSLVSIFSFGNLTRSVSTPDLCSAQAKDSSSESSISQRTYLAMTV